MGEKRLTPIKIDEYKPLRDIVFEALREAIIDGTLKPGERLMELQLAEELGVSRTPIREAIRKLELEGLVVMIPRKGAYVAGISIKDIADVFEIRAALESLAAGLAAQRITEPEIEELYRCLEKVAEASKEGDFEKVVQSDTELHDLIYRASRNSHLVQLINRLREQIQRFRSTTLSYPGRIQQTLSEHENLVRAISRGDSALARALAQEHIENAENSMMEALRDHPEFHEEPPKDVTEF
ncbi:MAG: GntR family transcriptional regulator [Clostridia bacterium]|nr:GntR family transcriptional regulator [Clostridia bacterium]